ncbi:DISARM system phospholipase D-like protein DrmC [Streptomyces sp. NBC_00304]|uniref:DISARM system phospholipase D-like protein DrmC n=1 Tax=Streptomyces sp. NBC_00304 TaxID=2975706 RepID=UPI002E2E21C5|nr:DISARM system phospholipase D-like protein DrmC [Streptomyces sp. NBC_00304]
MTPTDLLEEAAVEIAERLPYADITQIAHACRVGRAGLRALEAKAAGIAVRAACQRLRGHIANDVDGRYAAGLLIGAAKARQTLRSEREVDVVWTGPSSAVQTARLTTAVVSELIDSATTELLLVSYASYPPASLSAALASAATRGVEVSLLLEQQTDNPRFTGSTGFSRLPVTRLRWPAQHREPGAALHAKIIVVDRQVALIGSANLTGHAFEKNFECGILLRDASSARAIADHIDSLREAGVLTVTG